MKGVAWAWMVAAGGADEATSSEESLAEREEPLGLQVGETQEGKVALVTWGWV